MKIIQDVIASIRAAWHEDTAAAGIYDPSRPAFGQCAVTALLVQDLFGGELLRAEVEVLGRKESHYWNRIPGLGDIDLTREQYTWRGDSAPAIPNGTIVPRSRLLEGERAIAARTPERYQVLKERWNAQMGAREMWS